MSERAPYLEILSLQGPATIQDGGRPGFFAEGVPAGGALSPGRLALANRALGNRWWAPAIESFGAMVVKAWGGPVSLSVDGEAVFLGEGEELRIAKPRTERLIYIAARGGLDVPLLLGGYGTLAVASFGGFEGRIIRRGDRIRIAGGAGGASGASGAAAGEAGTGRGAGAGAKGSAGAPPSQREGRREAPGAAIRVVLGPDLDRFNDDAVALLCNAAYEISPASDRVGMRLEGPALGRLGGDGGTSSPMVRGAIQVARGGVPIVFGPDHPVTGGYPIIAAVIRADWGRLEERPIRSEVRFRSVSVDEAREAWRRESLPLLT